MPQNYRITTLGIIIKEEKIPAACQEIQELVEKVIKLRGLSYGVRVFCYFKAFLDYRLNIAILDADSKPFGLLEYVCNFSYLDPIGFFHFHWYSSTITNIPGEDITLEDHIKRVLAHTFKPINRERRSCL